MTIDIKIKKNITTKAELDKGSKAINKVQVTNEKIASSVRTTKNIRRQLGLKHTSISMVEHYIK